MPSDRDVSLRAFCALVVLGVALAGCGGGGGGGPSGGGNGPTPSAMADMRITVFNAPSAIVAGQTYTVTGNVANVGNAAGVASAVVTISPLDITGTLDFDSGFVGLDVYPALMSAGASWNFTIEFTAPDSAMNGNYYIGVIVPYTPESDSNPADNVRTQALAYSGGTTCTNDAYEANNDPASARLLVFGTSQEHNHCDATVDWVRFEATAGTEYGIATTDLGSEAWTVFKLYDRDAQTILGYGMDISTVQLRWTAPTDGSYYLKIMPAFGLDNAGANSSYRLALGQPLPDLTVSSFTAPSTALIGGSINVSDVVSNEGFVAAGAFDVSVYLGTQSNVTTNDRLLGTRNISALAVGQDNYGPTVRYQLPSDVVAGTYYIAAIANASGAVAEFTRDNNVSRVVPIVVQAPSGCTPDLYEKDDLIADAKAITVGDPAQSRNHCADDTDWVSFAAVAGDRYSVRVMPTGGYAQTWVELYAADGTTRLAGNATNRTLAIDWQAPASGTYYLKIGGVVNASTDYTLRLEYQRPDMTQTLSIPSTTVTAGGFLNLNDTVTNIGFAPSGPFEVGFYRGGGSTVTPADTRLGSRSIANLALPGSNDSSSMVWSNVHFSKDTPPGTYYLAAIADWSNAVSEVNENNNTSSAVAITVAAPACAVDAYEDDDFAANASAIALGQTQSRNFCDDSIDWASFTPATDGTYVLYTSPTTTRLLLYQSDGTTPVTLRDSYFTSRISFQATGGTTYRLATSNNSFAGGNYQLANFQCTQTTYDAPVARTISVGETQTRNHCDSVHDWSKFNAVAGQTYTIRASGSNVWMLTLYSPDRTSQLATGQSRQGGKQREIVWTAPSTATYYLHTRRDIEFGLNTDYTLSLN